MAHQCVAALLAEQATEKTRAVTAAIDGLLRGQIAQRVIRELHIEHVHILERHPHAVGIFLIEFKRIGEERDIAQANGVQRNGVRLLTVFVAFHRGQRRGVRHGVIWDFFCR